MDAAVERGQRARLADVRKKRDAKKTNRALDDVRDACAGTDNLLARFIAAAHAECTLAELTDVLRASFGEHKEPKIL